MLNKAANRHNTDNLEADSLIRDFLLCDGARYRVADFPELAKILKGEKINYWKEVNGFMVRNEEENSFNEADLTFRVPDLRSMFIQYVIPTIDMVNKENNIVGDYEIDSNKNPKIAVDANNDNHYHYIVLDTTHVNNPNTKEFVDKVVTFNSSIAYEDGDIKLDSMGLPVFNKSCKPLTRFGSGRRGRTSNNGGGAGASKRLSQAFMRILGAEWIILKMVILVINALQLHICMLRH